MTKYFWINILLIFILNSPCWSQEIQINDNSEEVRVNETEKELAKKFKVEFVKLQYRSPNMYLIFLEQLERIEYFTFKGSDQPNKHVYPAGKLGTSCSNSELVNFLNKLWIAHETELKPHQDLKIVLSGEHINQIDHPTRSGMVRLADVSLGQSHIYIKRSYADKEVSVHYEKKYIWDGYSSTYRSVEVDLSQAEVLKLYKHFLALNKLHMN